MNEEKDTSSLLSRRSFVGSVAAAAGFMIVPRRVLGGPGYQAPSDRVQVATVGYINGMGTSNTNAVGKVADVVALCDCDESAAGLKNAARTKIFENFPNAVRYKDYRVMLEKQKDIDGIRRAVADNRVAADRGRAAFERGPIVFCLEGADNDRRVINLLIPDSTPLTDRFEKDLVGGVMVVRGTAGKVVRSLEGGVAPGSLRGFRAIHTTHGHIATKVR